MGKYFKYAIGEILLVVIGILIALQINNWNEQSKEAKVEQTFLKRLQVDLEDNILKWNSIIASENKAHEARKIFVRFAQKKNKDSIMRIMPYFNPVARWDDITMNQVTFNEMQNSGKLDVISNDSIKIKLLQLDNAYQKIFNRRETIKTGFSKYAELINDTMDFSLVIPLDNRSDLVPEEFTNEELQLKYESWRLCLIQLVENKGFTNFLIGSVYSHELVIGELNDARTKAEDLLELINKEIKSND